jgi:hypothetical protein
VVYVLGQRPIYPLQDPRTYFMAVPTQEFEAFRAAGFDTEDAD